MSLDANNNPEVRLDQLLAQIAQGEIMPAMREYYDDAVVMEEPLYGRTEGLAANLEREQRFLDSVKQFTQFDVRRRAVNGNVSFTKSRWVGRPRMVPRCNCSKSRSRLGVLAKSSTNGTTTTAAPSAHLIPIGEQAAGHRLRHIAAAVSLPFFHG